MEGTQIEGAVPKQIINTIYNNKPFKYEDYMPLDSNYYILKTSEWSENFIKTK